jgi:hypothetical protein
MQSIEILIVIVLIQYHAPALVWASCGKRRTTEIPVYAFQNDGVQKRIAADEKRKSDASKDSTAYSESSKSVDYSSFLVFRTLRPR